MATPAACPVESYARAVIAGEIVAGILVKMACERHLRDLETGHERGLRWNQAAADRAIKFFSLLRLPVDGELDGKAFELEPFQQFIVGSIFGWQRQNAKGQWVRRFKTAYIEIGKGNGKSPLAAGIGLYCLVADGEAAAEVYAAATKLDQARILWRDAFRMVEASPALRDRLDLKQGNIGYLKTSSFFRPISSEKRGLDGPRPHCALIDEIHEHPDDTVVKKIRAGRKNRRQALIVEITNSGHDRTSICWQHHELSTKILEGVITDDEWFAYVCNLDPCEKCKSLGKYQPSDGCPDCDQWDDPAVFQKANPGLGTIITLEYLVAQVAEAKNLPTQENWVKRVNFCCWTEGAFRWLSNDLWSRGAPTQDRPFNEEMLAGLDVWLGLDFGWRDDLAALVELYKVLLGKDGEQVEHYFAKWHFWLPREGRRGINTAPIRDFISAGLVEVTEGEQTDIEAIYTRVAEIDAAGHIIRGISLDPSNARAQGQHWMALGYEVDEFSQNVVNYNEPCRLLESLLKEGRFHHGSNLCANWMASNAVLDTDGAGRCMPKKVKSAEKIDGICALLMALRRAAMTAAGQTEFKVEVW